MRANSKFSRANLGGRILRNFFFLPALVAVGFSACSTFATFETQSPFRSQPIVIDGKADDWQGDIYVVENERFLLGFLNDQDYLYMCLLTEDYFTRGQFLIQGLTVWFDPTGKEKKAFGIRYPLGGPLKLPSPALGEERAGEALDNVSPEALGDLEIVTFEEGKGKEKTADQEKIQKMQVADAKGIEVKMNSSAGRLVYELKIPLVKNEQNPIAIGTPPGKTVGIGFETGRSPQAKTAAKTPKEFPGGGQVGGGSGGGGTGRYGGRGGMVEGIKVWALVRLSTASTPQKPETVSISKD